VDVHDDLDDAVDDGFDADGYVDVKVDSVDVGVGVDVDADVNCYVENSYDAEDYDNCTKCDYDAHALFSVMNDGPTDSYGFR